MPRSETEGVDVAVGEQLFVLNGPRVRMVAADLDDVTLRPDLDDGAVRIRGPVELASIAAVHVDTVDAEFAVREAAGVVDAADMGDPDAEFLVGEAEDHELAWYDPSEVAFLVELG